jgi:tRNA-intron endonuclease, archaea type
MLTPKGQLIDNRIIIWDLEQSKKIYGMGFYGKPLGIPKPKGIDFESPLILDLIEGLYLLSKSKLSVVGGNNKRISINHIIKKCKKEYNDFELKYIVFEYLRNKGYVVSPGIKFGCDFAIYERGPGIDHAPFLVQVYKQDDSISATQMVLAGRLATTVKKQFIIAIPKVKSKRVTFIAFDWWRA